MDRWQHDVAMFPFSRYLSCQSKKECISSGNQNFSSWSKLQMQNNDAAPAGVALIEITADVVTAYVTKNPVSAAELSTLIGNVHGALVALSAAPTIAAPPRPEPAVPIRKSVTNDFIICLEDGKKFKSLKRHLATKFGMTPQQYRERWGLPSDYPMTAPAYSAARSEFARKLGLGKKRAGGKRRKKSAA